MAKDLAEIHARQSQNLKSTNLSTHLCGNFDTEVQEPCKRAQIYLEQFYLKVSANTQMTHSEDVEIDRQIVYTLLGGFFRWLEGKCFLF